MSELITETERIKEAIKANVWVLEEKSGLPLLFSPLLLQSPWLRHAFTTRQGGSSPPPLESFNLARHWQTEESIADALSNRVVLCNALELDPERLAVPSQQHTNNVLWIEQSNCTQTSYPAIDALATALSGQSLLLHFADCVPVIMADTRLRRISVVHAGWRGTAAGIVTEAIKVLISRGSDPADIHVAVGPAIRQCCFETGPEPAQELAKSVPGAERFIEWRTGRPYPDLQAINALQALHSGVHKVDISHWCTACHPQMFYSHRQSGGKTGRQGAIACIAD